MNIINCKIYLKLIYYVQFVTSLHWSYELQENWGEDYHQCFGEKQSPIAINTDEVIFEYLPAVEFVGYRNIIKNAFFLNNGHSVQLKLQPDGNKPYIFGGKLNGVYELDSLHFHWGLSNNIGSEHRINQIRYPMEMHFVHRNQKYATLNESMSYPDGLAVVAVLFNAVMDRNPRLNILIDHIMHLKKFNSSISVYLPLVLQSLLPTNMNKFLTYEGSLTTPPCSESVTWIIFPETVDISQGQLAYFRKLQGMTKKRIVDNFRNVQNLNKRCITLRSIPTRQSTFSFIRKFHSDYPRHKSSRFQIVPIF